MPKLTKRYISERLAQRRLIFLLGAGASVEGGLPTMAGLTQSIEKQLTGKNAKIFSELRDIIKGSLRADINIERILDVSSTLRKQISTLTLKTGFPRTVAELENFEVLVRGIICRELSSVREAPHVNAFVHALFRKRGHPAPIWFFSTNNDILLESALDKAEVDFRNGFIGYRRRRYDPRDLESDLNPPRGKLLSHPARLCKLHGSITYGEDEKGPYEDWNLPDRDEKKLMIYPASGKFEESHRTPFHDFQSLFQKILSGANTLFVIGYSFSDIHLNSRIQAASELNGRLTIFAFMKTFAGFQPFAKDSKSIYGIGESTILQSGKVTPIPKELENMWQASHLMRFIGGI